MTKEQNVILALYSKLNVSEQNEVVNEIKKFVEAKQNEQASIKEAWSSKGRIAMGPTSSGTCALCGR